MDSSNGGLRRLRPTGLRGGIVVGFVLALVGMTLAAAGGITQFQQVIVVNPPASPIPVVQQGAVSISNLPSNQSVTVSNFPATQPVSGSVTVDNVATRVYNNSGSIDAGSSRLFSIPNGINLTFVRVSDLSLTSDSVSVHVRTATGFDTKIFEGDTDFSHEFATPVAVSGIDVVCTNAVLSCDIEVNVIGY
jgi:hypothetical protein